MADKFIDGLNPAAALSNTDEVPIQQTPNSAVKTTLQAIATFVGGGTPLWQFVGNVLSPINIGGATRFLVDISGAKNAFISLRNDGGGTLMNNGDGTLIQGPGSSKVQLTSTGTVNIQADGTGAPLNLNTSGSSTLATLTLDPGTCYTRLKRLNPDKAGAVITGAIIDKIPIYDGTGIVGYIPIYNS